MSEDYILVIDDDPKILRLIRVNLERHGYRIETTSSGVEALARIKERRPSLLITDDKRPEMSGPELIAVLRDDPNLSDLPVILLTGRHPSFESGGGISPSYREADALNEGMPLQKPFNPLDLVEYVKHALAPRHDTDPATE